MKNLLQKLRTEDWVVVWVSVPLLLLAIFIPKELPSVPSTLVGSVAWYNIALLFAICLVVLYAGSWLLRRPMKGLLLSFVFVFAVSFPPYPTPSPPPGAPRFRRSPITASSRSFSRCFSGC